MIFFDFDGVVVDSLALCSAACKAAAATQGMVGDWPANPFAHLDPLTFEKLAANLGLNPERFAQDVCDHVLGASQVPPLFPGMKPSIEVLSRTHDLVVISASNSSAISRILRHHGLEGAFAHVIGGDMPGHKAEKIAAFVSQSGHSRHCMIGDAVSDIDAARQAGIPAISVTWGWQSAPTLAARSPSRLVNGAADLVKACEALTTKGE